MMNSLKKRPNQVPVQVLERALSVLDVIASRRLPTALHEVVSATGIHPSTVHRLLWNLAEHGFLEKSELGNWRLGMRFLEYGSLVRDRLEVREKALPLMQVLYEKTGQTINLSMRQDDSMMYVEHVFAPLTGVRLARQVGALAPLHCSSGGKLALCECTPEEVSAYIARSKLRARTEHSIVSAEKLILELNRVKELGWAEDNEELEHGIQCIGASVRNEEGRMIAALTIVSSTDMRQKPEWVRHLLSAASAVSATLGWLGPRD